MLRCCTRGSLESVDQVFVTPSHGLVVFFSMPKVQPLSCFAVHPSHFSTISPILPRSNISSHTIHFSSIPVQSIPYPIAKCHQLFKDRVGLVMPQSFEASRTFTNQARLGYLEGITRLVLPKTKVTPRHSSLTTRKIAYRALLAIWLRIHRLILGHESPWSQIKMSTRSRFIKRTRHCHNPHVKISRMLWSL